MLASCVHRIIGAVAIFTVWCCAGISGQRQLKLSRLDYDAVEGVYTEGIGSSLNGIRFVSTVDTLYVGDLKGNVILRASEKYGPFRLVQLIETVFLQYSDNGYVREYEVPASMVTKLQSPSDMEPTCREMLAEMKSETAANVQQSVESSILRTLEKPEIVLLERAAFSIGDHAINGREYACALPLYIAALQIKKIQLSLENMHMGVTAGYSFRSPTNGDDSCLQLCPPCPEESCLGMCGPSCDCWSFVCGDCCYHLGCYDHDVCCRKKFYRTTCLFPVTFRCEKHYNCTEGWA